MAYLKNLIFSLQTDETTIVQCFTIIMQSLVQPGGYGVKAFLSNLLKEKGDSRPYIDFCNFIWF